MRSPVWTLVSMLAAAVGTAAVVAVGGCAHLSAASRGTRVDSTAPSDEDGSLYSLASSSSISTIYSSQTVSFALDRIDQRGLPLDRTYRHPATGKGVTVYVFDGGVSSTHPELAGRVRP